MVTGYELYVPRKSWLHRLDPRTKLAFVVVSFAILLPTDRITILLGYLMAVHLLLWRARMPGERVAWLWKRMWPLSLLILLLQPLSHPVGEPVLVDWWWIQITLPGIRRGLLTTLRVNGLAFAFSVLLLTTDQATLVQGLAQLGVPFEWSLALSLGLRYLPLLHSTYGAIVDAQRARGWTPERAGPLRRLTAQGPTLVALVIFTLRLVDQLTFALAARGFRPGWPRTARRPLRLRRIDQFCLTGLGLLAIALLALQLWFP